MDIFDLASAVAIGNIMTLSIVLSLREFHRHDHNAPWLAYLGVLLPVLLLGLTVVVNEGLPPQFDAIAAQF